MGDFSVSNEIKKARSELTDGQVIVAESICKTLLSFLPDNTEVLILLSCVYFKKEDMQKSYEYTMAALEVDPNLYGAYNNLGNIFMRANDVEKAVENFKRAVTLEPKYFEGHLNLANAYLVIKQTEEALKSFKAALECDPSHFEIRSSLGDLLKSLGRYDEAKDCYYKAIAVNPNFASAWFNLGQIYMTEKEFWLAIHYFERTTKCDALFFDAHKYLGDVLKTMKIYDRALQAYSQALQLCPNNAIVLANIASTYSEKGLFDFSIEYYKKAIEIQPNFPDAFCNLANAYKEKGLLEESEKYYNTALELCPNHADSYNNLANVRREAGMTVEAARLYLKALEIRPNFAAAHSNYASILHQQGQLNEALMHYKEAIKTDPNFVDAYSNMGNALKEIQDFAGAISCYNTAIQLNPLFADAHSNLGSVLKDCGYINLAISSYLMALNLKPKFPDAVCNLAHCYQIVCDWTNYDLRVNSVVEIVVDQLKNSNYTSLHPHHSMLYPLPQSVRKMVAAKHATVCESRNVLLKKPPYVFKFEQPRKLKIGYVSSDFCNHPTTHLMQSIPACHDRTRYEIYCYALNPSDGSTFYSTIVNETEHFVDLSEMMCHGKMADRIYEDGIHILVNMNGYTKGAKNEIFALRPAPIQVMWLGYPGTSGAQFIDYLITDKIVSPLESEEEYSEKFAYMCETFFIAGHKRMFPHIMISYVLTDSGSLLDVYSGNVLVNTTDTFVLENTNIIKEVKADYLSNSEDGMSEVIEMVVVSDMEPILTMITNNESSVVIDGVTYVNGKSMGNFNSKIANAEEVPRGIIVTARLQYGLPDDAVVFCNFNQLYKLNPSTFELWGSILKAIPNSVLWLLRFPNDAEVNLRKYAKRMEISDCQLIFSNVAGKEEHVRRGQLADICLDTPLCNGHTTSTDILWAGIPIVTLPGPSFASRVAASILYASDLPELVAESAEDYQNIAIKLGSDKIQLNMIKHKIRKNQMYNVVYDSQKYTENLEYLYEKMWSTYCQDENPDHIL